MPHRVLLGTSALSLALAAAFGAAPAQAAHRASPTEAQAVHTVASAVLDRLEIADEVAASKWLSGKPVADPVREQAVIDATIAAAKAARVDPVVAVRIMRAQITASKQVQYALIARWHAHRDEAPTTAPDLTTVVRRQINEVDARLISAIGAASDAFADPSCSHFVTNARGDVGRGLDDVHRKALRTALRTACTPES